MPFFIKKSSLRMEQKGVARHATWLEIFFDLIFAVIVIQLSERLLEHLSFTELLLSTALFIPLLWTWASYTVFAARFDKDDIYHWLLTFLMMFAGIIMAIQIPKAFESGAAVFSIGFILGQMILLLCYTRILFDATILRNLKLLYLLGYSLGFLFWTTSLFFDPPLKFVFWTIGMLIYFLTPWIGKRKILSKAPLDNTYIPERFGAFTIIILGQIIASVVFGQESAERHFPSIFTSILSFILAIIIWVQYYRFTLVSEYRCSVGSGQPYIYSHIPLILSLIFLSACVQTSIKTSTEFNKTLHIIFYTSILLYLSSFYLLQFISFHNFKLRGISYLLSVLCITLLFFLYPLPPFWTILGLVLIFACLFTFQYWLGILTTNP